MKPGFKLDTLGSLKIGKADSKWGIEDAIKPEYKPGIPWEIFTKLGSPEMATFRKSYEREIT